MLGSTGSLARLTKFTVLVVVLLLAACGRKGPLDLPPTDESLQPGQSTDTQPGTAARSSRAGPPVEYNAEGRPLAPRGQKKKLPADVLID